VSVVHAASLLPEAAAAIVHLPSPSPQFGLQAGKENLAAFLETRRTSAYLGGTTEANKWEGITFDSDNGFIYTAISDVAKGMEDSLGSGRPNNGTFDNGACCAPPSTFLSGLLLIASAKQGCR
jgi:hypothetical protein